MTRSNDTDVTVNELNNSNTGNNGTNKVVFSGMASEYTISTSVESKTVTDNVANRDGINVLNNVENLQFADQIINL